MSSYKDWNDKIAGYFFRPEKAGQPVWLYLTDEIIQELATQLGNDGLADFVIAVKAGPQWARARGFCQRALQSYEGWRERGLLFPPYIAYLALFVLAAGLEGEFAAHAYYPRLRALLGEPGEGSLPSFDQMLELWDDLEKWSTRDRNGELGTFVVRHVGKWIYVGVPLAQTILSEDERKALPGIFVEAGFDPTSPPSDEELARALRMYGRGELRHRTLELVETRYDPERFAALLDIAGDELAEWTGILEVDPASAGGDRVQRQFGALRLCLRYDPTARTVQAFLRARLKREFPEERLVLSSDRIPALLTCEETLPGWSSPLAVASSGEPFDAALLDWKRGVTLAEERLGWYLKLPASDVRVFVKGETEGLPGLVEIHQLPARRPFYLIFSDSHWPRLELWTRTECRNFRVQAPLRGLPDRWLFASSDGASSDEHVRSSFPILAFSSRIRVRFIRGIRSMPGSNFFAFAPPEVMLDGGLGSEEVQCQGRLLRQVGDERVFRLPADLPVGTRIIVEVLRGGEIQRALSLYLTGDFDWRPRDPLRLFDRWGDYTESSPGAAGAYIEGPADSSCGFRWIPTTALGFERLKEHPVFFVGRFLGQIVRWPSEPIPYSWEPVWAVQVGRRQGRAIYCAQSLEAAGPQLGGDSDRSHQELWKEILWHRRKKIAPPETAILRKLWNAYVEAAHGA